MSRFIRAALAGALLLLGLVSPAAAGGGELPLTLQVMADGSVQQGHIQMPIVVVVTNTSDQIVNFEGTVKFGGWSGLEVYPMVVSPSTQITNISCGGDLGDYCVESWSGSIDAQSSVLFSTQIFSPQYESGDFDFLDVEVTSGNTKATYQANVVVIPIQ